MLLFCRTHFNYDVTEHGELSFKQGDIFQITDTLYSGVVGSWQAIRVARTSQEAKKGIIPNLNRFVCLTVLNNLNITIQLLCVFSFDIYH